MERSPKELVDSLGKKLNHSGKFIEKKLESGIELSHVESIDIYELMQHIQTASKNSICIDGNNNFPCKCNLIIIQIFILQA